MLAAKYFSFPVLVENTFGRPTGGGVGKQGERHVGIAPPPADAFHK